MAKAPETGGVTSLYGVDGYPGREDYSVEMELCRAEAGISYYPFRPAFGGGYRYSDRPVSREPEDVEFTSLACLMHGIKGLNYYMVVERDRWLASPITRDNRIRKEYFRVYQRVIRFLREIRFQDFRKSVEIIFLYNNALDRLTCVMEQGKISLNLNIGGEVFAETVDFGYHTSPEACRLWIEQTRDIMRKVGFDWNCGTTSLGVERLAEYRRTIAAQSLAAAKKDVVERGLVATVVGSYYAAVAAQRKSVSSQRALEEAQQFADVTRKLEKGGEVAHADVLKSQLVLQQRQRELQDARLAVDKSRIALAVLMFPDYRLDFELVDDLASLQALPAYDEVEAAVRSRSPELRAAEENIRQEEYAAKIARAAYLPTLSLDYFFGINARQFAIHDSEGFNRLGSAAQATLNIPVWDWWSTKSKVRQADMKRQQARLGLELSRHQLISNLHSIFFEAQTALAQLDSLKRSQEDAAESLRLTNLRYEAGEISVLEVVDAQSTLVEARNAYDGGMARYRLALANIQTLTGKI